MDFTNIYFNPGLAFFGGSIGVGEWVMLFVVVLVVVGPKRLPEVARKFGQTMEMFRRAADEFKDQLMNMDQDVKDTVNEAAGNVSYEGVEGDEGPDDAYGDSYDYDEGAYEDEADYPGNEDFVSEWESDEEESDDAVAEKRPETPDEVASSDEISDDPAEEVPDDPARGNQGSTEEKA